MARRDRIVINQGFRAGDTRASVEVTGDEIVVDLDEAALAAGPAEAIAAAVSRGIAAVKEPASAGTIARRRADGSSSRRLYNVTGHLAAGIRTEPQPDGSVAITMPSDRFQAPQFSAEESAAAIAKLRELVPAIDDPLSVPEVDAAIERTLDLVFPRR